MKKLSALFVVLLVYFSPPIAAQDSKAYLNPPQLINLNLKPASHAPDTRKFTGISSMAVSDGTHQWAVWYTGITPEEDHNNYVVFARSKDRGNSWEELLAIDPDGSGPVRAYDPEIWVDPLGRLWVFWTQTIGMDGSEAGVWAITTADPEAEEIQWTSPRRLTDGVMMCKPVVLSSGEWVLPASTWKLTDFSARMVVSTDNGESWALRGAVNVPEENRVFDEHMIVERKDGSLWMLIRTDFGIGESFSFDKGKSWSDMKTSIFAHPSARFFITRLNSGNLLMVKHGPIRIRTARSHLMAFISQDDGRTWSRGLLLDERLGISYPDGQQHKDGTIYITYDYDRRRAQEILMTSFKEEDILSKEYDQKIIEVFQNRKRIGKGGK